MQNRKCLNRFLINALLFLGLWLPLESWSAPAVLDDLRFSADSGRVRLVFNFNNSVEHSIFTLSNPDRLVIDFKQAALNTELSANADNSGLLGNIRSASRDGNDLRIVLDLMQPVHPKSFLLKPSGTYGHRLVLDLFYDRPDMAQPIVKALPKPDKPRDVVIAIDAGHGGKDPGALGRSGAQEKSITLAIAKRLAEEIGRQQGMQAVLIRDGDYFVGLRERTLKARKHKVDMFISIHADAYHASHAQGSSVYALSLRGATSEAAKWLADKENAADLVGGISLDDKDDLVASVLLDLSQTATIQSSLDIGEIILNELGQVNRLHKPKVQQAGFLVLKSPDIPSILVETAFLTNPDEEKKLSNSTHQDKIVTAILKGVKEYFSRKAPPGTQLAKINHATAVASSY